MKKQELVTLVEQAVGLMDSDYDGEEIDDIDMGGNAIIEPLLSEILETVYIDKRPSTFWMNLTKSDGTLHDDLVVNISDIVQESDAINQLKAVVARLAQAARILTTCKHANN